MAGWYATGLAKALAGDLDTTTVTAHLVTDGYTYSATHSLLSEVPTGDREATQALASVQVTSDATGAQLEAADTTFSAATGDPVVAVVVEANGDLLFYHDDFGAGAGNTTLPLNGSDVTVQWPGGVVARINLG